MRTSYTAWSNTSHNISENREHDLWLMTRKRRTYSPVYQRTPKRTRFASSERVVMPEKSAARGVVPDKKVGPYFFAYYLIF